MANAIINDQIQSDSDSKCSPKCARFIWPAAKKNKTIAFIMDHAFELNLACANLAVGQWGGWLLDNVDRSPNALFTNPVWNHSS